MNQELLFPDCSHSVIQTVFTPELQHFAKEVCADCGAFLRWLPKPENIERQKERQTQIEELQATGKLSAWEREFVATIIGQRTLSPKQAERFNAMLEKHFGVKEAA
jgi:hypothetical protein